MPILTEVTKLPEYDSPPVVEVAIGLHTRFLYNFDVARLGYFWGQSLRTRFRQVEQRPPLAPVLEEAHGTLAQQSLVINVGEGPAPVPRTVFVSEDRTRALQVQQNFVVYNWKKGDQPYPRYSSVKAEFLELIEKLSRFVVAEDIGVLSPLQCEVTYVNHISPNRLWSSHADASKVVNLTRPQDRDSWLDALTGIEIHQRHELRWPDQEFAGRLHVKFQSGFRLPENEPIFALAITARAKPRPEDTLLATIEPLFDREHEQVVRSFASIITPEMQKEWGLRWR
jgi:uncharacterized protein (TIGR04255 family)